MQSFSYLVNVLISRYVVELEIQPAGSSQDLFASQEATSAPRIREFKFPSDEKQLHDLFESQVSQHIN